MHAVPAGSAPCMLDVAALHSGLRARACIPGLPVLRSHSSACLACASPHLPPLAPIQQRKEARLTKERDEALRREKSAGKAEEEGPGMQCVVCWAAPREVIFEPCNHVAVCGECAQKLREERKPCPCCRQSVKRRRAAICP